MVCHGSSVFSFWRNLHAVLHSGCTSAPAWQLWEPGEGEGTPSFPSHQACPHHLHSSHICETCISTSHMGTSLLGRPLILLAQDHPSLFLLSQRLFLSLKCSVLQAPL